MKYKSVLVILFIVLSGGLFAGCGDKDLPPISMAIVVGKHANQNNFTEKSFEKIEPLVRRAVYGGDISIIIADGIPRNTAIINEDGTCVDFRQDAMNSVIKERRIKEYSEDVMSFLRSDALNAVNREVDLLAAIKEAERTLHHSQASEKHIVIMDTGLSTAGRVDLTTFDLDTIDLAGFVKSLKETEGILPDLTGVQIHFIGLGDVAAPQALPDTTLPKLENLWKHIFLACGVSSEDIQFIVSPSGTQPNLYSEDEGGFPYVTVIDFTPVEITINSKEEEGSGGELLLPDVGFHSNTAEMIDETKAKMILQPYADAMNNYFNTNSDERLYLVGTTATTVQGGEGDVMLSQQRANKLKETLSALGVPADRLIVLGVGAKVPEHLRVDEFRDDKFDSGLAQENRKATAYAEDNADFQEILSFNGIALDTLK